ncbi:MAG: hypothetical protein FWG44_07520 [Oscillospiraceae bacterium]|nr:hypothetical protein [Oscillospiraceae bacterium]
MDKRGWIISVSAALLLIVTAAVFLLFKLGQQSVCSEKWKDYDDYGWA